MELPLLKDILIIFGLSIGVILLFHHIRIPASVGLLITGVLAGPYGLGLIRAVHEVEIFAEIGLVLLLFTIGIEFSLEKLSRMKKSVLLGGSLQVILTVLITFLISRRLGFNTGQSVFVGFLASLSSTAIVLKILQDRAEIESPHGQSSLAILIYQDIVVIPMMLLIPLLVGGSAQTQGEPILTLILKAGGIILFVLISANWVVPALLFQIVRTRSRELFIISVLLICFAVALLTYSLGLSLALGAFLAGLIISETEYGHETLGHIIPFKDVFISLFFVSIGMLLNINFFIQQPVMIIIFALAIILLKGMVAALSVLILGFPLKTGLIVGLSLCQIGEFSFILFMRGTEFGLLSDQYHQLFLSVSVLTMGFTPFAITLGPRFADMVLKMPWPDILVSGFAGERKTVVTGHEKRLRDHLIIIGFGLNGRNVARAAGLAGIPYVIVEMNPYTVRLEKKKGTPIFYGDATREAVLEHARVHDARAVVLVISDHIAIRQAVAVARKMNPNLFIIARTRFVTEMKSLYDLGADEVIPEEFETSIEIFSRVLAKYLISRNEIDRMITDFRAEGYQMFRSHSAEPLSFPDLKVRIPNMDISVWWIEASAPIVGQSLDRIRLRRKYGLTLMAIYRGEEFITNPSADTVIQADDRLVILAEPPKITEACHLFMNPGEGNDEDCHSPDHHEQDPSS
ncbi:MAG TPA: potassium transporter KefB [Deltaproteobacteria bacterium]|nr:potassium transporter KefB [Deltaproteobacteria bacterium]